MSFTEKWGRPVRQAVERMALAPEGLSARAIHAGLRAGAVDGIAPADVPPAPTVAKWVHEHRRAAREAIGDAAGEDTLTVVAARLRKQLKRRAGEARTAAEIRAVASAARELAALERDLASPGKRPGPRPNAAPAPGERDDTQRAFLESMARDDRPSSPPQGQREDTTARGTQHRTEQNGQRSEGAAAS